MPIVDGENAVIEFEIKDEKPDGFTICNYKVTDSKDLTKSFLVQHFGYNLPNFNDPVVQKALLDSQIAVDPCAKSIAAAVNLELSKV